MNRRAFLQSAASLALPGSLLSAGSARRPNILLILSDDLGYGDLTCYGAPDIRTPNLDRLAAQGVRFTQAYANQCVCSPTRAALLTGRYQQRAGFEWVLPPVQPEKGLLPEHVTIATRLKNAGYRTGMFGKWHLGYRPEFSPNAHGFEEFFGFLGGNADYYAHRDVNGVPDLWHNGERVNVPGYLTDLLAARAGEFIGQDDAGPFFCYLAFNAVHWPFQPPGRPDDVRSKETWQNGNRRDYAAMVEAMDSGVGQVLRMLDQRQLTENTLVIFTNDNGGERYSRNAPLFHGKHTLWEGGIRVPAIVRWPGKIRPGGLTRQVAASMDFAASILSAASIPLPGNLDGLDLLPVLTGAKPVMERTLCWRVNRESHRQQAIRRGSWKYIRDSEDDLLFDVEADPSERNNEAYLRPELVAGLRATFAAWQRELARNPPPFTVG